MDKIETVFLPIGYRKGLHDHATRSIAEAEAAISRAKDEIKRHETNIKFWKAVVEGCAHGICPQCKGHKGHTEWIAQDETRWHPCKPCNGTGEVKDPPDMIGKIGLLDT